MSNNLKKYLTRKHALLSDDIFLTAHKEKDRFVKLTAILKYTKHMEIVDGGFYFDFDWFDEIIRKYRKEPIRTFKNFINRGYIHGEKLKKYARRLGVKRITDLKKVFWESVELLKNLVVFLPVTHPLAKAIELNVIEILKKKNITENNLTDVLLEISTPRKLNTPLLEVRDLEKIRRKLLKLKDFNLKDALRKHLERYAYLGYREPFSSGYSEKFFKERLNNPEPPSKPKQKYKIILSPGERQMVNLLKEFVYFRNYRTEKLYEGLYYFEKFWQKVDRHFGLRLNDLAYYSLKEAQSLFDGNIKVNTSVIDLRRKGYAVTLHHSKLRIISGKELERKKKILEGKEVQQKELHGLSACVGKVVGTVRVVMHSNEQGKIKKGDILVTLMTTPDFLPSMKRAAAFVTDEGGITCHAAIISREMNKPCVIGTKIATKVLKDGDLVEVDAEAGVVKKIRSLRRSESR